MWTVYSHGVIKEVEFIFMSFTSKDLLLGRIRPDRTNLLSISDTRFKHDTNLNSTTLDGMNMGGATSDTKTDLTRQKYEMSR